MKNYIKNMGTNAKFFVFISVILFLAFIIVKVASFIEKRVSNPNIEPKAAVMQEPVIPDSVQLAEKAKAQIESEKRELTYYIQEIGRFDRTPYRGSKEAVISETKFFEKCVLHINTSTSDSEDVRGLCQKLKEKLIALQIKEFPSMRKEYADIADGLLWEKNIRVSAGGRANTDIIFIGGRLADNARKKEIQDGLGDAFNFFRFKKSIYKWHTLDDEYTYYEIESKKDSDL